jgi:hypothetical protein
LRALLSGRGQLFFLTNVYSGLLLSGATSVDELAAAMPAILPAVHAATMAQLAGGRLEVSDFERQSVLLIGWSRDRQRIVGWSFEQIDPGAGFVAEEVDEFYLGPWDDELGTATAPRQLPQMIETAKRQRDYLKRRHPGAAAGGELIAAHIDRDGVTMRAVHRFAACRSWNDDAAAATPAGER